MIAPYGSLGFFLLGLTAVYKSYLENFLSLKILAFNKYYVFFIAVISFLAISNIFSSLSLSIGGVSAFGETPIDTAYQQPILYFVLILFVTSLCIILARKRSPFEEIIIGAVRFGYIVSALGLVQILYVFFGISIFGVLIDFVEMLGWSPSGETLVVTKRISSIGSEPAALAQIIPGFLIPVYLYKFKTQQFNKLDYIQVFFLSVISFLSFSSSVIYGWIIVLVVTSFSFSAANIWSKLFLSLSMIGFIGIAIVILFNANPEVLLKLVNLENQSTSHRLSTLINDFYIFIEYPLFGIGNGNQGFFYNENIEGSIFHNVTSKETTETLAGMNGVINGGSFLPAYISGYGVAGSVLLLNIILQLNKLANFVETKIFGFKTFWLTCSMHFLISSVMSMDIHGNIVLLLVLFSPFYIYVHELRCIRMLKNV